MSQEETGELYRLIRDLTEQVNHLAVAIARIETQLSIRKECPSPGLCLGLQTRLETLEKRAATADGERAGLTLAGKAVWAFIGSGGVAVIAIAYNLLKA